MAAIIAASIGFLLGDLLLELSARFGDLDCKAISNPLENASGANHESRNSCISSLVHQNGGEPLYLSTTFQTVSLSAHRRSVCGVRGLRLS
jgi:hypothetical protein